MDLQVTLLSPNSPIRHSCVIFFFRLLAFEPPLVDILMFTWKTWHRSWYIYFSQGLEGYFQAPGIYQNMVRNAGNRKISWGEMGFDYQPGNRFQQNLGTGCGIFLPVCCEFRNWYVLAADVNQPGKHTVVAPISIKANYLNCQVIMNRRADRKLTEDPLFKPNARIVRLLLE